ncbi:MAG: hypothetical protein ACLTBV_29800 [Enterocloster bolteae]
MVYEFLQAGEENALSPTFLKNYFTDLQALGHCRNRLNFEQRAGHVILSSTLGGYYRASTANEIRRFIKTLESRGSRTLKALDSAKALLREIEGVSTNGE